MNDLTSRLAAEYESTLAKRLRQQREPHASDCAIWVLENCDCVLGNDNEQELLAALDNYELLS